MKKLCLALTIAFLFGAVFYGTTNWQLWVCICVGMLVMWICLLIFMAITNITLRSKGNLLKEIERHEKLEERLVEDILSLIELYNYLMPNSSVTVPKGTEERLHKAIEDINKYMEHRPTDVPKSVKDSEFHIGDSITLPMEDGDDAIGTIIKIGSGEYLIRFPFPVSLIEQKEPDGGWKDNAWPQKELYMTPATIEAIRQGYYIGTTCHYHF